MQITGISSSDTEEEEYPTDKFYSIFFVQDQDKRTNCTKLLQDQVTKYPKTCFLDHTKEDSEIIPGSKTTIGHYAEFFYKEFKYKFTKCTNKCIYEIYPSNRFSSV
jgi:hypothetical protein